MKHGCAGLAMGAALSFATAGSCFAQDNDALARFYRGKQINVIIYSEAGSTYDLYARLLSRHMGRHIPGAPNLVPQNMPGAGGLKATDYLYNIAPKDGSVIGTISRGNPFEPMLGGDKVNFDPLKFLWLGSMNREVAIAVSWFTSPVKTLSDLKQRELIIPGSGAGSDNEIMPLAFNNIVGTRFKIIAGYSGSTRATLAMERGEVDGMGYLTWGAITASQPGWLRDKKLNILLRTGDVDDPNLAGVPKIRDAANNEVDRQAIDLLLSREVLGRPFLAPPALPTDRAAMLKPAFIASVRDPQLLDDAKKAHADIDLVTGDEVSGLLQRVLGYPQEAIDRAKGALNRAQ